jgi:hypothetical protein
MNSGTGAGGCSVRAEPASHGDLGDAARWTLRTLAAPVERLADAADHGDVFIEVIGDAGCCGWDNASDDQTLIHRNGRRSVIYDERERFHNDNYDVSFFTPRARLSADVSRLSYTIASTAPADSEIRLAESGKAAPEELWRVRKAMNELPRVEVLALSNPGKITLSLPGELVGWLDARRILLLRAGELIVVDAATGAGRPTRIKADGVERVFIR